MFLRIFVLISLCLGLSSTVAAKKDPLRTLIRNKDFTSLRNLHQLKRSSKLKRVKYTGYLNSFYIDYEDHSKSRIISRLDISYEKSLNVFFNEDFGDLEKIEKITVKGYEYDGDLAVEEYLTIALKKKFILQNDATSSDAHGTQNLLVALAADPINNTSNSINSFEFIERAYFSNDRLSLRTYFDEVSNSKIDFDGEVLDQVLLINNLCDGSNPTTIGGLAVINTLASLGVNVELFNRFSVVVPFDDNCIFGALGIASIGHHTVFDSQGAPLRYSVNFIKSTASDSRLFIYTLAHEFGHNLGLKHDAGNSCGKEIFSNSCPTFNYGGEHSLMGQARTMAHVNAIQQEDLGWMNSQEILTLNDANIDQEVSIAPLSSFDNSLKTVKVRRADGSYYVLEYRKPIGLESLDLYTVPANHNGYLVYLNNDNYSWDSILLDSTFNDYRSQADIFIPSLDLYVDESGVTDFYNRSLFTGEFVDEVNKIRVVPLNLSPTEASFRILTGDNFDGNIPDEEEEPEEEGGTVSSTPGIKEGWEIDVVNDATTDRVINFSLNKNSVLPSVDLLNEIKSIEWDFDGDLIPDFSSGNSFFASHQFDTTGLKILYAKITFQDDTSIEIISDPVQVESLYELSLGHKQVGVTSEPSLSMNGKSKYVLNIQAGSEFYTRPFKIKLPRNLKGLVKIKKKSFKVKPGKNRRILITFAPEAKFIARGITRISGYYEIRLTLLTKETKKAPVQTFSPELLIKSVGE